MEQGAAGEIDGHEVSLWRSVKRSKSRADLIACRGPTYGLTAGYRNVAMAVPEPSLQQDVCPSQAISTIGDHHDARRGSDLRWAVERERGSRPVHRGHRTTKPETACTTSPAATTGKGEEKTANSMAVEKSAVLPDAGGANSAAPTVQSGGKPLKVSPDCPPDSKPK